MADHNHSAVKILYRALQDILCAHVKMIGRLIEYQKVHWLKQELYHGQASLLAARKDLDLFVGCLSAEHERPEDIPDLGTHVARSHIIYRVEHRQFPVEQLGLILREIAYLHIESLP